MITVVNDEGGDWVAIYRNGKLLDQKHSFQEAELLRLVDVAVETIWDADASEHGFFPTNLEDVKRI